jgi:hypothetical protein
VALGNSCTRTPFFHSATILCNILPLSCGLNVLVTSWSGGWTKLWTSRWQVDSIHVIFDKRYLCQGALNSCLKLTLPGMIGKSCLCVVCCSLAHVTVFKPVHSLFLHRACSICPRCAAAYRLPRPPCPPPPPPHCFLDVFISVARHLHVCTTRHPSSERWYCGRECWPIILPKCRLPRFI